MKANEAPEKIYCGNNGHGNLSYSNKPFPNAAEYTRTDAFILEKVINFLNYKLDDVVATRVPGTIIPHHVAKQELIEDLKKHIEGE